MSQTWIPAVIEGSASSARREFLESIRSLPPAIRAEVSESYERRTARAAGRPLLGEYTVPLLAEVLGIDDPALLKEFVPPVMSVYAASLLMDDLFDREADLDQARIVAAASALLIQRGLGQLYRFLPSEATAELVDTYFAKAAEVALREIDERRFRISPYSDQDVWNLGEKGALLKLVAELMALAAGNKNSSQTPERMNHLLVGVQLLDDVTDWQEDWEAGHFTYLLTLAAEDWQDIERSCPFQDLDADGVFLALVLTPALESVLDRASFHLLSVLTDDLPQSGTAARDLIESTAKEATATVTRIRTLRIALLERLHSGLGPRDLLTTSPVQAQLNLIQDRLFVVAQDS
jgi:hypothetical protein